MWVYDNLEACIAGVFASGVAMHFAGRWQYRRRYLALRDAFEHAVRRVQATDQDPAAVVRCAELERDFMQARWLGWCPGLGARVRTMLKVCAALILLAFLLKGPIERGEAEQAARAGSVAAKLARDRPMRVSSSTARAGAE